MSTIVKDSNNKSTSLDTGQKLTAVRVIDIILDISHPKAINLGGYDSIGTIFYTILKNNTPLEEIKTSNIARPIFPHLKYYPLKNEVVLILSSQDKNIYNSEGATTSYYLPSLNIWNHPHHNAYPNPIIPNTTETFTTQEPTSNNTTEINSTNFNQSHINNRVQNHIFFNQRISITRVMKSKRSNTVCDIYYAINIT